MQSAQDCYVTSITVVSCSSRHAHVTGAEANSRPLWRQAATLTTDSPSYSHERVLYGRSESGRLPASPDELQRVRTSSSESARAPASPHELQRVSDSSDDPSLMQHDAIPRAVCVETTLESFSSVYFDVLTVLLRQKFLPSVLFSCVCLSVLSLVILQHIIQRLVSPNFAHAQAATASRRN